MSAPKNCQPIMSAPKNCQPIMSASYTTVVELLANAKCECGSRADVIQDGKGYFCAACWVSRFAKHA